MYYYKKPLDDNTQIAFLDDTYVYNFNESFIPIEDPKLHFMRGCPVGVAALPNGRYDTIYHNIKGLQDAYEYTMSDWGNEIGDTRLAYLVLAGLSLDEEEDSKTIKEKGIIEFSNADGRAEFLVKS